MDLKKTILSCFVAFTVFLLLLNCKPQNANSSKKTREIIFGSGGGFTGKVTEYLLNSDRNLFKITDKPRDTTLLKIITKQSFKDINQKIDAARLDSINLDEPGNIYHFITIKGATAPYTITWGDPSIKVPEKVKHIYGELMSLVNNQTTK